MSERYLPAEVWAKARALVIGYWPALAGQLIEDDGTDTDTATLWRTEFASFAIEDLLRGIREMANRLGDGFPSLPVLLPYLKAARHQRHLNTPSLPSGQSRRVESWENERISELREFNDRHPHLMGEYELGRRIAKIREDGPFFQRVRGLFDGTDTRSVAEWWRETFGVDTALAAGPQPLGQIIAAKEPTLEDEARRIATDYRANPADWPQERVAALPDDVRSVVRELLAAKTAVAATTSREEGT